MNTGLQGMLMISHQLAKIEETGELPLDLEDEILLQRMYIKRKQLMSSTDQAMAWKRYQSRVRRRS